MSKGSAVAADAPPRSRRKAILFTIGLLVVLIGVLLALAPQIASKVAPGIIATQAGKYVKGSVVADAARFSWGGPQRVGPLTWKDDKGEQLARVTVESSAGLLGLARGNLDLGTVVISDASANLVRHADGTLNVQRMLVQQPVKPAPPAPPGPARLPDGLKVKLVIDALDLTLADHVASGSAGTPVTISLRGVKGEAAVDRDQPLRVKLNANARQDSGPGGTIAIDATATNWAARDGTITLDKATLASKATIASLPVSLLDAIIGPIVRDEKGQAVPLVRAIGPTLDMTIDANGSYADATAKLALTTNGLRAGGDLRVAQNVLSTASPLTVDIQRDTLRDLVPVLAAATREGSDARITQLPDATLTLESLKFTLPAGGKPLDLRGSSAKATLALGEVLGQVALAGGGAQPMRLSPTALVLESQDFSGDVRLTMSTSATLGGNNAGEVQIDMKAAGLLDENGSLRAGLPGSINGSAQIRQIRTAIAQPFVGAMGLDLQRDIGPTLDLGLLAASAGKDAIDLDITGTAEHLNIAGGFTLTPQRLATKSNDFAVRMPRAASLAGAFLPKDSGVEVRSTQGSQGLTLTLRGLDIPRDIKTGSFALDQASTNTTLGLSGVQVVKRDTPGSPVDLADLQVRLVLSPQKDATFDINGSGSYERSPFTIKGNFSANKPLRRASDGSLAFAKDMVTLNPAGRLQVIDLPTMIAGLVPMSKPETGAPALDVARAAREVFGERVGLDFGVKRTDEAQTTEYVFRINGAESNLVTRARVSPGAVKGTENFAKLRVSPGLFDTILRTYAPDQAGRLRLADASFLEVGVAPFTIPLASDGSIKWDGAKPLDVRIGIPGRVMVAGLDTPVKTGDPPGSLKSVGLDGLRVDATVPLDAIMTSSRKNAGATIAAKVLGNGERLADLSARVDVDLAQAAPKGPAKANISLSQIDTQKAERALGQDALLTGVLGDTAQVTVNATHDIEKQDTAAELTAGAPRLKADGPIALHITPVVMEVTKAASWRARLEPAWINAKLRAKDADPKAAAALQVTQPVEVGLKIDRLVLPRGEGAPPLAAALNVDIPRFSATTLDNQPLELERATLRVNTDAVKGASPPLRFDLGVASARTAQGEPAKNLSLSGVIEGLVGPSGAIDATRATVTTKGDIPAFPTSIIDALAKKDGLLVEALGPMITLELDAKRVALRPGPDAPQGTLHLRASSDRANLLVDGDVDDAVLRTSKPLTFSLTELSEGLAGRVLHILPSIGSVKKTREDAPAMITGEGLTIPLSNDLAKFNGVVRIDPGEARYGASTGFGKLLDMVKLQTVGQIGRRLEPLTVTITDGVATYPRYSLPLGEFTISSEGKVDMVNRRVDVITWVPLGSLTEQVAGLVKADTGLGNLLGKAPVLDAASLIPLRTKGEFGKTETGVDLELLARNMIDSVRPDKLIEKGLQDLFKPREKK